MVQLCWTGWDQLEHHKFRLLYIFLGLDLQIDALGRTGQNAMMFALDVKSMPVHPLDHLLLLQQQQQLRWIVVAWVGRSLVVIQRLTRRRAHEVSRCLTHSLTRSSHSSQTHSSSPCEVKVSPFRKPPHLIGSWNVVRCMRTTFPSRASRVWAPRFQRRLFIPALSLPDKKHHSFIKSTSRNSVTWRLTSPMVVRPACHRNVWQH